MDVLSVFLVYYTSLFFLNGDNAVFSSCCATYGYMGYMYFLLKTLNRKKSTKKHKGIKLLQGKE